METNAKKILEKIGKIEQVIETIAQSMVKMETSHTQTLEHIVKALNGIKSLHDRVNNVLDELGATKAKNPNEGYVLLEEEMTDSMLHLVVGFKKPVTDADLEMMKQECQEKYQMSVAFACKAGSQMVEVYLQNDNVRIN